MNIRVFHKTELASQSQRVVWGDVADKLISRRYRRTAGRPGASVTRTRGQRKLLYRKQDKVPLFAAVTPRFEKSVLTVNMWKRLACGGCLLKQKLALGERGKFATVADSPSGGFGSPTDSIRSVFAAVSALQRCDVR